MHYVSTDLALRGFDQLLDLLRERVDLRPFHRPAQWVATSVADRDIPGDGLLIHPDQLRGRVSAACQIERFQNLHDLPVRLGHEGPSSSGWSGTSQTRANPPGGAPPCIDQQGRVAPCYQVRQPGDFMSADPERDVRLSGSSRVRRHGTGTRLEKRVPARRKTVGGWCDIFACVAAEGRVLSKHLERWVGRCTAERLLRGESVDAPDVSAGLLAAAAAPPRDGEQGGGWASGRRSRLLVTSRSPHPGVPR